MRNIIITDGKKAEMYEIDTNNAAVDVKCEIMSAVDEYFVNSKSTMKNTLSNIYSVPNHILKKHGIERKELPIVMKKQTIDIIAI